MINAVRTVRWRLLIGIVSLVTVLAVTLPTATSRMDPGHRVAEIWPNAELNGSDPTVPPSSPGDATNTWYQGSQY